MSYEFSKDPIFDLQDRLKEVFKNRLYIPEDSYNKIMYIEGQQSVLKWINEYIDKECKKEWM